MHKLNNILSKRSTEMEALVWETAEELDKKVAEHLRNIRKRRQISQRSYRFACLKRKNFLSP